MRTQRTLLTQICQAANKAVKSFFRAHGSQDFQSQWGGGGPAEKRGLEFVQNPAPMHSQGFILSWREKSSGIQGCIPTEFVYRLKIEKNTAFL
jgi:hypothetical protein